MKNEGERKRKTIKGLKRKGFRKTLDSIEALFNSNAQGKSVQQCTVYYRFL